MNEEFDTLPFKDMENKGFMVIPSFLSNSDINHLLDDFEQQKLKKNTNKNYNNAVTGVSESGLQSLRSKTTAIINQVTRLTDINVSISSIHLGYYFASKKVAFSLHQDYESFYALQNHYNYLNFFIPLKKPLKNKGNLNIIPWDEIKAISPEAHDKLVNSGGTSFNFINNKTYAVQDEGIVAEIPIDIRELRKTPELNAGDLLLIRGDTIHETQDADTDRIAISVRFTNSDNTISRKDLLSGGKLKSNMMANNWNDFGPMVRAFKTAKKETITWREMQTLTQNLRDKNHNENTKKSTIKVNLISQKIASGTLISSIKHWINFRKDHKRIAALKANEEHNNQPEDRPSTST